MVMCTSKSNGKEGIQPIFLNMEIDDSKLASDLPRIALNKLRRINSDEVED